MFRKLYYKLNAEIEAFGVDTNNRVIKNPIFVLEEFLTTRLSPLLNYVFFDDNSSDIPDRYTRLTPSETNDFYVENLYRHKTLPIYHNILNIVGRRMRMYDDAVLRIVGCNSDMGDERRNISLSRKRADNVKKYLMDVWNIPENRLIVEARNLPYLYSSPKEEPDKIQENRRVELYSNNDKIMEYVFLADTMRTINPPKARFKPKAYAQAGLKSWDIIIKQGNKIIKPISSQGVLVDNFNVELPAFLEWDINSQADILAAIQEPLKYSLRVIDSANQEVATEEKELPIELLTIEKKRFENLSDKRIDKYSLILFDFDRADIKGDNEKIVDLIKSRLADNSRIRISGYTDRTGDPEHNKSLSLSRANATERAINRPDSEIEGLGGSDAYLYPNDLPEGRFYNRTVDIQVVTVTGGQK